MEIKEIANQAEWDRFQTGRPQAPHPSKHGTGQAGHHSQFLQSWAWGEFQRSVGRQPRRLGFYDTPHPNPSPPRGEGKGEGERLLTAVQLLIHRLPLGLKYLYGPRVDFSSSEAEALIKKIGRRAFMLRFEPKGPIEWPIGLVNHSAECRQPAVSLLLDLSPSLDELMSKMHEKTRYNIRLSQRKGLTANLQGEFKEFWPLMIETSRRDKIKIHPRKYYERMLESLRDNYIKSRLLTVKGSTTTYKSLAGGIFIGYGDTFTYLHGASSGESREMMAPYLLHWTAICQAKELGYKYYDFWGVNPADEKDPNYRQSWEGISRFKLGFGGERVTYGACQELPLREVWYNLYNLAKLLKP